MDGCLSLKWDLQVKPQKSAFIRVLRDSDNTRFSQSPLPSVFLCALCDSDNPTMLKQQNLSVFLRLFRALRDSVPLFVPQTFQFVQIHTPHRS